MKIPRCNFCNVRTYIPSRPLKGSQFNPQLLLTASNAEGSEANNFASRCFNFHNAKQWYERGLGTDSLNSNTLGEALRQNADCRAIAFAPICYGTRTSPTGGLREDFGGEPTGL
jgi:hypothetical protein